MRSGVEFFNSLSTIDPAAYGKEFSSFNLSAKRFELLASYSVESERGDFEKWVRGEATPDFNSDWLTLVSKAVARGAKVSRVRGLPRTCGDYLHFEIERGYTVSRSAGEDFRFVGIDDLIKSWPSFCPLIDAWIFDDLRAYAVFYDVRGVYLGARRIGDQDVSSLVAAFDRFYEAGCDLDWALHNYVPSDHRTGQAD
jgi:hypothetical protein